MGEPYTASPVDTLNTYLSCSDILKQSSRGDEVVEEIETFAGRFNLIATISLVLTHVAEKPRKDGLADLSTW